MSTNERITADLLKSGLLSADMDVREATHLEFAAIEARGNMSGYTIPYYDIMGKVRTFYRVRLFDNSIKYKQPKNTSNHVYFPKSFQAVVQAQIQPQPQFQPQQPDNTPKLSRPTIILVEGEKKAASVTKAGLAAVGFGGVDSWRNRTLVLPEGTELSRAKGKNKDVNAKVPAGNDDLLEQNFTVLATGLSELIDLATSQDLNFVVIYDRDHNMPTNNGSAMKPEVQRAASALAFELRFRGVPYNRIHQLILPHVNSLAMDAKVGVDDFIQATSAETLIKHINQMYESDEATFPQHPNIRDHIGRKLQKARLDRKELQALSMAILSDLDAHGKRLRTADDGQAYYFDKTKNRLIKASMSMPNKAQIHETHFGQLLYQRYSLSASDTRVMTWLDAQYHSEQPISTVIPHRVIAKPLPNEDVVRFQIGDGEYVKVTADPNKPIQIMSNGAEGFLFEAGQVLPTNGKELLDVFTHMNEELQGKTMPCWWDTVLSEVRLEDQNETRKLTAILYYVSPWLFRWRGAQLPAELILGESGSGKSSLCEHRLNVITGEPKLRNAPAELKDWHASVTNTGGLHIIDNVQLMDKQLRQRLSDEMCRLITEPNPRIEKRKLYSDNELVQVPVGCCFAITAIQQPFVQADLLARSMILKLDKTESGANSNHTPDSDGKTDSSKAVTYDAQWVSRQMSRYGGRTRWIAHQLLAIHRFLLASKTHWNSRYKATHRLINLEQSMILMGDVFGVDMRWLPQHLTNTAADAMEDTDWALEGLTAFAQQRILTGEVLKLWSAADIAMWAMQEARYMECTQLTNVRRLGKYLQSHRNVISTISGVIEHGSRNNSLTYVVKPTRSNTKGIKTTSAA